MRILRHGDLGFTELEKIPEGLTKIEHDGSFILAYGEHTGHAHRLAVAKKSDVEIYKDNEGRYVLNVKKPATLSHEEHKTITFQPGIYFQRNEREYDPFLNEIRTVQD